MGTFVTETLVASRLACLGYHPPTPECIFSCSSRFESARDSISRARGLNHFRSVGTNQSVAKGSFGSAEEGRTGLDAGRWPGAGG
jgi:hypothetical protein